MDTWRELVDAAHLYGWTLADNCELRNRKGTLVHIVKIRKRRVRLEDDNGTLRGTLPVSQAGPGLGRYLEKVFYAQKCTA